MFFIVTDYCHGGDLFAYMLDRVQLEEEDVCMILSQCLSALNYMAENNIVHRDLKLENIMLQKDGDLSNIKLVDFGLSREQGQIKYMNKMFSGTPFYLAPESLVHKTEVASDLWSLGVIMYICIVGKLPFSGNSIQ